MIWYLIGAALWVVSLLLVITVFRMENARNSHRAMELEKRYADLRSVLRRVRGTTTDADRPSVAREGSAES